MPVSVLFMTAEQKHVVLGAVTGLLGMVGLVVFAYALLPAPNIPEGTAERLAYALNWSALAVLPLFVMLVAIGNQRFLGGRINPLARETKKKSRADTSFDVDVRVAANTLEQTLPFVIGLLALSTLLPPANLTLIGALAVTFVLARVVFWIGYRRHYLARAPGMAATFYLNAGVFVAVLAFLVL